MLCPELELRHFPFDDQKLFFSKESSIDLLSIDANGDVALDKASLPHEELVKELGNLDSQTNLPALRVLFINTGDTGPALSLNTANYLCDRLGVTPSYAAAVTSKEKGVMKTSRCHWRRNPSHEPTGSMEVGWYTYSSSMSSQVSFVWFSYEPGFATYVVTGCDTTGVRENIADHVQQLHAKALLRPLAIDCIIAETVAHSWSKEISCRRQVLAGYEASALVDITKDIGANSRQLHMLSYNLIIISAQLADNLDTLTFLLDVHKALSEPRYAARAANIDYDSVHGSLSILLSEAGIRKRRLQCYIDRTQNLQNLLYHLSSHTIAQATGRTAMETKKDSSSMITVAALTMLFLPGTFISGLFSMDFFVQSPESSSVATPRWWVYPAITVPLTILVFVAWNFWMARRNRSNVDIEGTLEDGGGKLPSAASESQLGSKAVEDAGVPTPILRRTPGADGSSNSVGSYRYGRSRTSNIKKDNVALTYIDNAEFTHIDNAIRFSGHR